MGRVCVYDVCSVFYAPVNRNLRTWVTRTSDSVSLLTVSRSTKRRGRTE